MTIKEKLALLKQIRQANKARLEAWIKERKCEQMKLSIFFERLTNAADNQTPLTLSPEEAASIRDILDQLTDDFEKVVHGTYSPCEVCGNYPDKCDDPSGCVNACGHWISRSFGEG